MLGLNLNRISFLATMSSGHVIPTQRSTMNTLIYNKLLSETYTIGRNAVVSHHLIYIQLFMKSFDYAFWAFCFFFSVSLVQAQSPSSFYQPETIQNISISFEQSNWSTIMDSLRVNGSDMLVGRVTINGTNFENVGIRYAQTRAFQVGNKRNSLEVALDYIKKGQQYMGQSDLHLTISLRDPSFVREVLGYEMARQYMPAPNANFAKLTINDEYVGLYINVEPISPTFLKAHYEVGLNGGYLYYSYPNFAGGKGVDGCAANGFGSLKPETNANCLEYNFNDRSGNGYAPLQALSQTLKKSLAEIEKVLAVDEVLWMHAFNNVFVNLYSYAGKFNQNYYLYADESGVFHPILGELNLSFGGFKNIGEGSDLKLRELQTLDPLLHLNDNAFPLISEILKHDGYQKRYLAHMRTIQRDFLENDQYLNRAKALQNIIKEAFAEAPNQRYTGDDFSQSLENTIGTRSKIPGLSELMTKRANFLMKDRNLRILPPSIEDVNVTKREQFASESLDRFQIQAKIDRFPEHVMLYYREKGSKTFNSIQMKDDGNMEDGEAKDGVFGAIINARQLGLKAIEYYIVAENAKAIGYEPSHYMNEWYDVTLEEINR